MRVATIRIRAFLPGVHTLKEKRRIVQGLKQRLRGRFNVSVAETGDQDLWQTAELGMAAAARDGDDLRALVDSVLKFVRLAPGVTVTDHEVEYL